MIRDSNPYFRINLDSDPDVSQVAARMLWIHYLVTFSHFTDRRQNSPVTVREMLIIKLLKSHILHW